MLFLKASVNFVSSFLVLLTVSSMASLGNGQPFRPVCVIEANGFGDCAIWEQRLCTGNCNFEVRNVNGFNSCYVTEVNGPGGCGCGRTNICKCAANGIEYNIGNYCNANTKPISTVPNAADEAPPAPETAIRKKYMVKATGTDFCFDLRNSGKPKDDALVINLCDKSELSQTFIVESRDKGVGDIVKFRSFLEPDLCLQPISDIPRKRTLLQLADCEGLTNEVWRLENRDGSGAIRNLPLGPEANSFCLVPRGLPDDVGANSGMVLKKCKKAMNKGMIYQYTFVEV